MVVYICISRFWHWGWGYRWRDSSAAFWLFTRSPPQFSTVTWRTVLEFETLCTSYSLEACLEVFRTAYALRKTTQDARYFAPSARLKRLLSIWWTTTMAWEITWSSDRAVGSRIWELSVGLFLLYGTWAPPLAEGPCLPLISRRSCESWHYQLRLS